MEDKIIIDGRTRIIERIIKDKFIGHKRNCNHKMSENEAMNIRTNCFEDFRRCIKNCGFWKKKIIYFDVNKELEELTKL